MMSDSAECSLCFQFPVNRRYLPSCRHVFCHDCLRSYCDSHQVTSAMCGEAIPCPAQRCGVFCKIPLGGASYYPDRLQDSDRPADPKTDEIGRKNSKKSDDGRKDPEMSESQIIDPDGRRLEVNERNENWKKTVTWSSTERIEFENNRTNGRVQLDSHRENDHLNDHTDERAVPSIPRYRSTVRINIARLVPQQEVDVPDSAFIPTDDIVPLGTSVDSRKFREERFVFPSVTSTVSTDWTHDAPQVFSTDSVLPTKHVLRTEKSPSTEVQLSGEPLCPVEKIHQTGKSPQKIDADVRCTSESYTADVQTNGETIVRIKAKATAAQSKDPIKDTTPAAQSKDPIKDTAPNSARVKSASLSDPSLATDDLPLIWRVARNDNHRPTSLIFSPSTGATIVADYGKGVVEYLDENGDTTVTVDGLKPFSLALCPSGQVAVGDRREKTLALIDGETGDLIGRWETGSFPWVCGIGVLRNGNLVVSDRYYSRLGIYCPQGRIIAQFGSYGVGEDNICMADFLAVDSRDRIIVSDSANHCLKVFDANGRNQGRLAARGCQDGRLSWPKGICVDARDNVIVADSKNSRLSMFSPSGDFVRHLVSGIRCPFAVCFRQPNWVGVTHYSLSGYSQCDIYRLS